jgi:hypothetical protein
MPRYYLKTPFFTQAIQRNPKGGCRSGGVTAPESVRPYNQWISYENRSLPDLMIGVETSILPFAMDAAAPKGAPTAASITGFLGNRTCPAVPREGP